MPIRPPFSSSSVLCWFLYSFMSMPLVVNVLRLIPTHFLGAFKPLACLSFKLLFNASYCNQELTAKSKLCGKAYEVSPLLASVLVL